MNDSTTEMLKQVTVLLTRNCNLRCNFCFEKCAGYEARETIKYKDLQKIVDFCCDAGVKYLFLTGGEPLTYPYLLDILGYIRQKEESPVTTIATNGILLANPAICQQLIDNGIAYIDISMKGSSPEMWLRATGYDGFDEQLKGIQNLSRLPIEFTCSMVVTDDNVFSICDAVENAFAHGARQFSFTFFIDNIAAEDCGIEYLKRHNPHALISAFLSQTSRLNSITDDWWIEYSFPLCVYSEEQLAQLEGKLASPCQIHMKDAATFTPHLELLPCDMYFDQKIGKLGRDFSNYEEFLAYTMNPQYHDAMTKLRELPSSECSSCPHLKNCYGGCPVLWKNYSVVSRKLV